MSAVNEILLVSQSIQSERTIHSIFEHLCGEVIELSHEIRGTGDGKDGIVGEAVDVMLCAVDIMYKDSPEITEDEIIQIVHNKLQKWQTLYGQQEKQK